MPHAEDSPEKIQYEALSETANVVDGAPADKMSTEKQPEQQHASREQAVTLGDEALEGAIGQPGFVETGSQNPVNDLENASQYNYPRYNPDSEDPRENIDLAKAMAKAEQSDRDAIAQIKRNFSVKSLERHKDSPDTSRRKRAEVEQTLAYIEQSIDALTDKSNVAARQAKEEFFGRKAKERDIKVERQKAYESRKKKLIDSVIYCLTEKPGYSICVLAGHNLRDGQLFAVNDTDLYPLEPIVGNPGITADHIDDLRETVYMMLGAEPPANEQFDYRKEGEGKLSRLERRIFWGKDGFDRRHARVETPTNTGFTIVESRTGNVPLSNNPDVQPSEIVNFGIDLEPRQGLKMAA
jgi:hypothetical protein